MELIAAMLMVAGQTAATPAEPKPVEPKKVCRRETSTSSRLDVRRVCKTRAEWDAQERAEQRNLQRQNDWGRAGSAG
ncbi:hypothetical protein [Sphingomonas lenta]|uniref:Uncharacterized protein n=1 Tax=Sphingomonas lenta TaxID=1141887 RepID=A0A2A2SEN4_9SPHN|nr:hypothetical protein [Sphingomonas lenta]PAX07642.1 hypothetical protein CKY28_08310 [Sphingomonas lenta]